VGFLVDQLLIGLKETDAVVRERIGVGTAGEFGSWTLSTLSAVCADAVLDPEDPDENPLGL
jgi:hypothetical protein